MSRGRGGMGWGKVTLWEEVVIGGTGERGRAAARANEQHSDEFLFCKARIPGNCGLASPQPPQASKTNDRRQLEQDKREEHKTRDTSRLSNMSHLFCHSNIQFR